MTDQPKPLSDLPEWARHLPGYEASEAAAETAHLHARIVALEAKLAAMREAGEAQFARASHDVGCDVLYRGLSGPRGTQCTCGLFWRQAAWRKAAGEKP